MPTLHLQSFLIALLRQKPRDWSVVRRGNEIQIRPPDRTIGKFVVRRDQRRADGVSIGHYDRRQDRWTSWAEHPADPAAVYAYLARCIGIS